LEDFAALRFMHEAALTLGLGQRLALIPQMADPKNLFGTLLGDAQLAAIEPLDCMTA
jgi:ornithine cyclodeaminase